MKDGLIFAKLICKWHFIIRILVVGNIINKIRGGVLIRDSKQYLYCLQDTYASHKGKYHVPPSYSLLNGVLLFYTKKFINFKVKHTQLAPNLIVIKYFETEFKL